MLNFTGITPVHNIDGIFVKREDLAYWHSLEHPSGSKVRQYLEMAHFNLFMNKIPPENNPTPCIVGCSANSCQQIYVASTSKVLNTQGIIYVPKRAKKTEATLYCESLGCEINEVKPGYLSVIRKHAKQRAIDLKHVVQWDRELAILDTAKQCQNIPETVKRIIVPTGSGLTAAGIMIGVAEKGIEVIAVATSPMVVGSGIRQLAKRYQPNKDIELGELTFVCPVMPYDKYLVASLPDGTPLDPFYAAKAWRLTKENDLFWPPGLRPVKAMPEECQEIFQNWKGPNVSV